MIDRVRFLSHQSNDSWLIGLQWVIKAAAPALSLMGTPRGSWIMPSMIFAAPPQKLFLNTCWMSSGSCHFFYYLGWELATTTDTAVNCKCIFMWLWLSLAVVLAKGFIEIETLAKRESCSQWQTTTDILLLCNNGSKVALYIGCCLWCCCCCCTMVNFFVLCLNIFEF